MKKVLFIAGSLLALMSCTKDQSIEGMKDHARISSSAFNNDVPIQNVVHITASGFSPDSIMVNINSNVAWVNDDKDIHTVTSGKFDSGDILPGSMFKHAFDNNTGRYPYYCRYHPTTGVVVVAGIR